MLKKRESLSETVRLEKSDKIFDRLIKMPAIRKAKRVMVYVSFREEVDTKRIIEYLWEQGIEVAVPISDPDTKQLSLSLLRSFDDLTVGHYGVMEPVAAAIEPVDPKTIDIVVVPGVAFDRTGNRIGYGAGYYDRFLSQIPKVTTVAVAYAEQVLPQIPADAYDQKIELIVTDRELINNKQ